MNLKTSRQIYELIRTLLFVITGVLVLLIAIIFIRAWLHQPQNYEEVPQVWIDLDDAVAAQHLSEAVRFKTVSHQNPEDFDPGEFEGFIDWVAANYPEVSEAMDLELLGDYTMLYRWPGSNPALKPILLTGHYDVVPVIPGTEDQWRHRPYAGAVVDGIVWGRGTLDNKGAVIAQLEAASALLRSGFQPVRTVYLSFGHDEEVGGLNGAAKVAEFLKDQGVQLAWSLDEGSFLFDDILPGVEALLAVINVAEKGIVTLNIVAKAVGGHSSLPPRQTAVSRLATAITMLERHPLPGGLTGLSGQMFDTASRYMPFSYKVLFANRWLFDSIVDQQLSATAFGNAMLRTTIAPTMLSASVKVNVLPTEAIATVNFRIHPRDTVEDVINHVKSVVENEQVEVQLLSGSGNPASSVSDWNSTGFETIGRSVREIYGEIVVTPGLMIAASDTRHYGKVADHAFRFNPMMVTQEDIAAFHGTNEKVSVEGLGKGVRVYMQVIRNGASN